MIIADIKPFEEIIEMMKPYNKILNTGCAGCTAVCMSGGPLEVEILNKNFKLQMKNYNRNIKVDGFIIERQCEIDFIKELDNIVDKYDAIISMGCGAGVQLLAERYNDIPVFPALNTQFVGIHRDIGLFEEKCRSCGDCQLAYTAGICPITDCAKSLFNGPCGGPANGKCEVDNLIDCAWCNIYDRLKLQNRLSNITKIKEPIQWQNQITGTIIHEKYRDLYSNRKKNVLRK